MQMGGGKRLIEFQAQRRIKSCRVCGRLVCARSLTACRCAFSDSVSNSQSKLKRLLLPRLWRPRLPLNVTKVANLWISLTPHQATTLCYAWPAWILRGVTWKARALGVYKAQLHSQQLTVVFLFCFVVSFCFRSAWLDDDDDDDEDRTLTIVQDGTPATALDAEFERFQKQKRQAENRERMIKEHEAQQALEQEKEKARADAERQAEKSRQEQYVGWPVGKAGGLISAWKKTAHASGLCGRRRDD